ncbi:hypothetical protein [Propionicimonas sp.]|uniref:hypothetical protein n=1 Tax=Propionicimonas sp. TaxID=1955623 RepID=UPI001D623DF2|nr:hypothetical protein [Propionicimonas sp.]MBU3975914.1 hypothetical protein [Actinomycetota bacterium]MBU3985104.1 hypothetical protein [Actinomycetota bacterium]MBU4008094.1 hypothetical protein [Actinomycetota bacterium]MBU4064692.1 hypothetical protein [Actinomycetota bacterium]MBU4094204.1 hypothetical protein [Actinomycetota bacterium]
MTTRTDLAQDVTTASWMTDTIAANTISNTKPAPVLRALPRTPGCQPDSTIAEPAVATALAGDTCGQLPEMPPAITAGTSGFGHR